MYIGRVFGLLVLLFLLGCKSEVKETDVSDNAKEVWPKIQDTVGNIFDYYQNVVRVFSEEDKAKFAVKKDSKWGVVDNNNSLYYPLEYDTIVSNGSSIALRKEGVYEIYDSARNLLANIRSENLQPVLQGFYTSEKNGQQALINPNGMMILDHRFDAISGPKNESYFLGSVDGKWSAYDMAGAEMDSSSRAAEAALWFNNYTVSLKAYGPLKIGMTRQQIEQAVGWDLKEVYDGESCDMYTLGDDFPELHLMINTESGKQALERIYFYSKEIRTKSGIGIGSTKEDLTLAYGAKLEEKITEFDDDAVNIFYVPTDRRDKNYRLKFYSKNGVIQDYSIGRLPSILYVEGCL